MAEKTPLYDWHAANGGKLVEFAGWLLPVCYAGGQIGEHLATRKGGGLFDICHMGRFLITGPQAPPFLERMLTNRAGKLSPGRAHYTLVSDPEGRPIDDAYLYRLDHERWLLVVNAANRGAVWDWLGRHRQAGVDLDDVGSDLAMLALQGPGSETLLAQLAQGPLPGPGRNRCAWVRLAGADVFVSRTGYTGEPLGFELFPPASAAGSLWEALARHGAGQGVVPAGLGSRDTLRLEAGLPLYGHEYTPGRPIMAVPAAAVGVDLGEGRGDFVGREALEAQAAALAAGGGPALPRRVSPVAALVKGMMREGSPVSGPTGPLGELTSATTVPGWRFESGRPGGEHYNRPLGLALLDAGTRPGQEVSISYRGRTLPGVVAKSFARPNGRYLQPIEFEGGAM